MSGGQARDGQVSKWNWVKEKEMPQGPGVSSGPAWCVGALRLGFFIRLMHPSDWRLATWLVAFNLGFLVAF